MYKTIPYTHTKLFLKLFFPHKSTILSLLYTVKTVPNNIQKNIFFSKHKYVFNNIY